jgi:hypothetical protein
LPPREAIASTDPVSGDAPSAFQFRPSHLAM